MKLPNGERAVVDVKFMRQEPNLLDVVALTRDLPQRGLCRGQVGTIVEMLAPSVFEVEFSDDGGRTYATLALRAEQLLRLHYRPFEYATHAGVLPTRRPAAYLPATIGAT